MATHRKTNPRVHPLHDAARYLRSAAKLTMLAGDAAVLVERPSNIAADTATLRKSVRKAQTLIDAATVRLASYSTPKPGYRHCADCDSAPCECPRKAVRS